MSKKLQTMNVSGGEYAKVATRLLEFRSDNPRASIKTAHTINADGSTTFTTTIIKDRADEYSADSTGSATYSAKEMQRPKAFEKLETISVGRALSLLGYLNNGEIASTEEMEEFEAFKQDKKQLEIDGAIAKIEKTTTMDELKKAWTSLGTLTLEPEVAKAKNAKKEALSENLKATAK